MALGKAPFLLSEKWDSCVRSDPLISMKFKAAQTDKGVDYTHVCLASSWRDDMQAPVQTHSPLLASWPGHPVSCSLGWLTGKMSQFRGHVV